jgi:H+-transporting ATPase
MVINLSILYLQNDVISLGPRRISTSDVIRRSSDIRILGDADLQFSMITADRKQSAGYGALTRRVSSSANIRLTKKHSTVTKGLGGSMIEGEDGIRDPMEVVDDFHYEEVGLTSQRAEELLKEHGHNELPEKHVPKWLIFMSLLWQPMPLMIWAAIVIEAGIENFVDMAILIFIQLGNASIGYYETAKAGDAIAALKASLKPEATVKRDGKWANIDARMIVPGDLVLLAAGSAIPADCRTNSGEIEVDQAALTGESLPVSMYKGDSCKMGSTVARGEVEGTVEFTGANTFFGKTASLLGGSNEASNMQKLLMRIMLWLVAVSLLLSSIVFIYISINVSVLDALSFTVVLLVASIPLAMEIVTTTTLAVGSKELSHHGAIVARLAAIEDMAGMSILCSDKTGTLTKNVMEIQEETPVYQEGESQYTLLRYAAMAAKWHEPPRDALDTLTLTKADLSSLDEGPRRVKQDSYMPFDPIVKRTEGCVTEVESGIQFKTTKGAPHILLTLCLADLDNETESCDLQMHVEDDVAALGSRGVRSLAVAKTNAEGKWRFLGLLTFLDPPRDDTKSTIAAARHHGVMVKMITGDHYLIAKETARVLDMGPFDPRYDKSRDPVEKMYLPSLIQTGEVLPLLDPETKLKPVGLSKNYGDVCLGTDGFAQVFPEHKYLVVECLREMGYKVGMTGDGVNDAPALKRADIGIAVHGATDAARAAADIVLTEPGLSTIVHGVMIARGIFKRIQNFLTYRIAATLQLLVFFFIAIFSFKPVDYEPDHNEDGHDWPEFFHMPVLMLMLITLLNDGTLITIGYDNVVADPNPCKWNLKVLFSIGAVLASVACLSSLILLYGLLDSNREGGWFDVWDIPGLSYGQVTTAIYLKISISDFLTLFSARTGEKWFWQSAPSPILLGGAVFALSVSTIIANVWPSSSPDNIYSVGLALRAPEELSVYIWIYCILWWFIQDALKVFTFHIFKTYNIFDINNQGIVVMSASTKKFIKDYHNDQAEGKVTAGH